jgi:carbamoyl-phosphate synthase large subunit
VGHLNKKIRILMTGAGAPGGPGIIRCLQIDERIDLVVGDVDRSATGRYLNPQFVLMPSARDNDFIDKVLDICAQLNIEVIFPLVTLELFKFAAAKDRFKANGIRVIVSNLNSLNIANNKIEIYEHCLSLGLPVPLFYVANNSEELVAAVKKLGYPHESVVIKPGISNGSRGIRILDAKKNRFEQFLHEKPNSLFTTLDDLRGLIDGQDLPPMLASEYLPGAEVTVDSIVSCSAAKLIIVRTRDKMNNGISVAGKFVENADISTQVIDIVRSLDLEGPIGFQFKKDKDGVFRLLEINPRIQGTSVAAMGLNVNLPLIAVCQIMGWPWTLPSKLSGVAFARYYSELYYEA